MAKKLSAEFIVAGPTEPVHMLDSLTEFGAHIDVSPKPSKFALRVSAGLRLFGIGFDIAGYISPRAGLIEVVAGAAGFIVEATAAFADPCDGCPGCGYMEAIDVDGEEESNG